MRHWIRDLDRVLRGEATRLTALREGTIEISAGGLAILALILGVIYGFCMGWFSLFNPPTVAMPATPGGPPVPIEHPTANYQQILATTIKVPALFLLTLIVTFPSLYVFNALVGSRLRLPSLARLLMASLGVTMAVLASLGPIVAFFSVTTTSYPFMILLNVLLFAAAGLLGLGFLLQTLHRLSILDLNAELDATRPNGPSEDAAKNEVAGDESAGVPAASATAQSSAVKAGPASDSLGALDRVEGQILGPHVRTVFRCWMIVFALVGGQMAWVLRPFLGDPDLPFQWFRARGSNFFAAVWETARTLLGFN